MAILNVFALAMHLLLGLDAAARRTDGSRLQGEWQIVNVVEDGREAPLGRESRVRLRIVGDQLWIHDGDGERSARFTLDLSRQPRRLTMVPNSGRLKGLSISGIYQLEPERLLLCFPREPGAEQPTEFASRPGAGRVLLTLRRASTDSPNPAK
jgi:uncharacterized protein (TIGR03067 family)